MGIARFDVPTRKGRTLDADDDDGDDDGDDYHGDADDGGDGDVDGDDDGDDDGADDNDDDDQFSWTDNASLRLPFFLFLFLAVVVVVVVVVVVASFVSLIVSFHWAVASHVKRAKKKCHWWRSFHSLTHLLGLYFFSFLLFRFFLLFYLVITGLSLKNQLIMNRESTNNDPSFGRRGLPICCCCFFSFQLTTPSFQRVLLRMTRIDNSIIFF